MSFYLFQGRYTSAAFKAMVNNPHDREPPARKLVESFGGTLHHVFFAMGTDDVIALIEAPDDTAMASGAMVLAASGAFAGGSTTKLMTTGEAVDAMKKAKSAMTSYKPATG
ncbi:GYD domain-containing protein [Sulfitobacter sabulilitoris]|uniref:GYD domain-containing protein n=1 Tax=Sulfitobacter sabulilitoris TaxID=2562655 RepID=A0A5S3PIN0_9RHOB|nr:GYD domain-containing protein [Sulfitobacter sabulilitoris]TMM54244.1 GYD domain-containing protein [Sulfitobacter sabulilitoris]